MSAVDAVSRIQQIEATMVELQGGSATPPAAASTGFSSVLSAAGAMGASGLDASTTAPAGVTGQSIVDDARKYLGVPYVFGGTTTDGMDCSGLVQTVLKDLGIDSPRLVSGEATLGTAVPSLKDAKPGDLIVLKNDEHIVIYAGDDKVIHAPDVGRNVSEVANWLDDSDIETIRRVAPEQAAPAAAASTVSSSQLTQLLASIQQAMMGGGSSSLGLSSTSSLLSMLSGGTS